MQDKDMRSILKILDSVGKKPLTESAIAECGPMSAPAPSTPVTVNLSAGSAGEMAMILRALSGIGAGEEVRATGLMASPMDDPDIPGQDDVPGDDDMQDGVLGGLAGAGLGYMAGGIPGAIAGGYLGHKTQQAANRDKSVEEGGFKDQEIELQDALYDFAQEIQKGMHTYDNVVDELNGMFADVKASNDKISMNAFKVLRSLEPEDFGPGEGGGPNRASSVAQDAMDIIDGGDDDDYKHLEGYDNEPEEEYSDHKTMTKTLSGGLNREKKMFAKSQDGDNAMAVESIKERLLKALAEAKKSKPDFLDMDKDGNKKEPMKKAIKDKKKNPFAKTNESEAAKAVANKLKKSKPSYRDPNAKNDKEERALEKKLGKQSKVKEAAKPDYIDLDKDGNKKEPMKKAANDAKKKVKEAEVQTPNHELSDLSRKASAMAQIIKRKINSGEQMDDRDYNQMAELGSVLSRVGANFGPKSMKDVMAHMVQYTDDRNQEGHGYPEFNVDRFKELIAMAKSTGESVVGEISPNLAKRYTKAAKMDRDFNDDDIARLSKSGQSTQAMHRRNSKRTKGINLAKKRM